MNAYIFMLWKLLKVVKSRHHHKIRVDSKGRGHNTPKYAADLHNCRPINDEVIDVFTAPVSVVREHS